MKSRRYFACAALVLVFTGTLCAQSWVPGQWPVLKTYDGDHLYRIALPLGGIGTGTVSLGGRGELRDWEVMNVPAKNYSTVTTGNNAPFFAIHVQPESADFSDASPKAFTRLLAGPLYPQEYLHYEGRPVNHHGLPRFENATFQAAYPFGQVHLWNDNDPVRVDVKGFNPLIPCNEEDSGLPMAVLSYAVTNTTSAPLRVSVCGSLRNFVGKDGSRFRTDWKGDYIPTGAKENRNEFRREENLQGLYFYSQGVPEDDPAWGTLALTTQNTQEARITYRTASRADDWSNSMLGFWDDFSEDGQLTEKWEQVEDDPMGSLCVQQTIAPHETVHFTFFLTWSFPNRKAWASQVVGNYYCKAYPDAWTAAQKILPRMKTLEEQTLLFVNAFLSSTYPDVIKEAALFNLSALRSQTVFRLPSGHLMGWEGVMDRFGSCAGSCTHVWNYEQATPFLFGRLARSMREVEFDYATRDDGAMQFRVPLPLSKATGEVSVAADGQMGCILKMYRDWQLSGDTPWLAAHWDKVKKALSYAWVERGWDGNRDGVMEGSQHNTMDVNYFGPNPQMGFWYLGALKAAARMAVAMKDKSMEQECERLYAQGSAWLDEHLFNGEYYIQRITDPTTFDFLKEDVAQVPDFQLGNGCLVDQLVGQYLAHICQLGYLAKPSNIKTTLQSIYKYNYVEDFSTSFNNMRSYVMGKESGLLMASWPNGRLEVPFPYFAESMTGFEYTAATGMIYEGMEEEALNCIRAIRDRFDGAKRNPFNEPECGHHYARSMASWSTVLAWSGFHCSNVDGTLTFTSREGSYFWSDGYRWGTARVDARGKAKVEVLYQ